MVAWGAIASLAGKALGSLSGSGSSSNATQQLNREDTDWMYGKQSDYWKQNTQWFNENGYSMLKKGLMDAGYNPLMALGAQPLSGATVSGSAMDQTSASKGFEIPKGIMQSMADVVNTRADTNLKRAQTEENISRSNLESTMDVIQSKAVPYADRKASAEVLSMELDNKLKEEQQKLIQEQTNTEISKQELNRKEIQFRNSLIGLNNQEIAHYKKIIEKMDADLELSAPERAFLRKHPKQAEFISGVKQYAGAVGTIVGPVLSGASAYVGAKAGKVRNAEDVIKPVSDSVIISPTKLPF